MELLKKALAEQLSAPFHRTLISTKLDIPPLKSKLLCRAEELVLDNSFYGSDANDKR
jgi:hypothetical protein